MSIKLIAIADNNSQSENSHSAIINATPTPVANSGIVAYCATLRTVPRLPTMLPMQATLQPPTTPQTQPLQGHNPLPQGG